MLDKTEWKVWTWWNLIWIKGATLPKKVLKRVPTMLCCGSFSVSSNRAFHTLTPLPPPEKKEIVPSQIQNETQNTSPDVNFIRTRVAHSRETCLSRECATRGDGSRLKFRLTERLPVFSEIPIFLTKSVRIEWTRSLKNRRLNYNVVKKSYITFGILQEFRGHEYF